MEDRCLGLFISLFGAWRPRRNLGISFVKKIQKSSGNVVLNVVVFVQFMYNYISIKKCSLK
jgi:hypothetical protein